MTFADSVVDQVECYYYYYEEEENFPFGNNMNNGEEEEEDLEEEDPEEEEYVNDAIEAMTQEMETNLEKEVEEFEEINESIDTRIKSIEEEQRSDETPQKQVRKQWKPDYELSMSGKRYANANVTEKVDALTFVQVLYKCFQQMSLKKGIKEYSNRAVEGMVKELK